MSREVNGGVVPDDEVYAFPFSTQISGPTGTVHVTCSGMTRRDWFAGMLMAARYTSASQRDLSDLDMARIAYRRADALMKAREET